MKEKFIFLAKSLPKDIDSVLDIGSSGNFFKTLYPKVKGIDLENSDINLDLNSIKKLPLKDNSFDLVVVSHVLEHLCYPDEFIKEIKRVSKKYILVGLPNEFILTNRIKFLFGKTQFVAYQKYGHKHIFNSESIKLFILKYFGSYEKTFLFFVSGKKAEFIPRFLKKLLVNTLPSLFAREFYYLIKRKK